jgi:hypothetical protein
LHHGCSEEGVEPSAIVKEFKRVCGGKLAGVDEREMGCESIFESKTKIKAFIRWGKDDRWQKAMSNKQRTGEKEKSAMDQKQTLKLSYSMNQGRTIFAFVTKEAPRPGLFILFPLELDPDPLPVLVVLSMPSNIGLAGYIKIMSIQTLLEQ